MSNTKMAAMPAYGKIVTIYRISSSMVLKLDMDYQGLRVYKVYINDDPWLTVTNFTESS